MNVKGLFKKVIPPSDRDHREGFSNVGIINGLSDDDRGLLENELIRELENQIELEVDIDTLIIETLGYMKSDNSLPTLYKVLKSNLNPLDTLITSSVIYQINGDREMIDLAINSLETMDDIDRFPHYIYSLIFAFHYLGRFRDERTTAVIRKYVDHHEYIISANARDALKHA